MRISSPLHGSKDLGRTNRKRPKKVVISPRIPAYNDKIASWFTTRTFRFELSDTTVS